MMTLKKANLCAKFSCSKWNKIKISRAYHRWRLHRMVDKYANKSQRKTDSRKMCDWYFNTYPWPYSDLEFANWKESNMPDESTLVLDPSNCIIKHDTSYCAYKIYEVTGKWPHPLQKDEVVRREDWLQFLTAAGYEKVKEEEVLNNRQCHYVGIGRNIIWFERVMDSHYGLIEGSTYDDRSFKRDLVILKDFIWIKIR